MKTSDGWLDRSEKLDSSCLVTEAPAESTCAAGKGGPLSALEVLEVSNTTALYEKSLQLIMNNATGCFSLQSMS